MNLNAAYKCINYTESIMRTSDDVKSIFISILFKRFNDVIKNTDTISLNQKKELLEKFEKVVKCLRRRKLGIKDLYLNQQDNLEFLIELGETVDLKSLLYKLLYKFCEILNEDFDMYLEGKKINSQLSNSNRDTSQVEDEIKKCDIRNGVIFNPNMCLEDNIYSFDYQEDNI